MTLPLVGALEVRLRGGRSRRSAHSFTIGGSQVRRRSGGSWEIVEDLGGAGSSPGLRARSYCRRAEDALSGGWSPVRRREPATGIGGLRHRSEPLNVGEGEVDGKRG